jgi:FolB domain-containing protein
VDCIEIRDIRARGRHGWTAEERSAPQDLAIDVDLELDLRTAAVSDRLGDTADYAALHRRIVTVVETSSYGLIERLAAALLDEIFVDSRVVRAKVRIAKPQLLSGATPSVTLHRENARATAVDRP